MSNLTYRMRTGAFETNSSSSHSLVLPEDDLAIMDLFHTMESPPFPGILPDADGYYRIRGGEFGWGPFELDTPGEKAGYLLTAATYRASSALAYGTIPNETVQASPGLRTLRAALALGIACDEQQILFVIGPHDYIDHESTAVGWAALKDLITCTVAIFSPQVTIRIDNDNSPFWDVDDDGTY